jgi:hypothetical protein
MKFATDMIQIVTAFISSGVPPNTPTKDIERLQSVNHMESKKFFAFFVSVGVMIFFYFTTLGILFFVPHVPELITGCITVYTKTAEILAIIIGSYIGAQAVVDLKYNSSSNTSVESSTQKIEEHIVEEITVIETNQKEDDYELT